MHHLRILSTERVRGDARPGGICHIVLGFLGAPAGTWRWLPSALFDGLHEDPDQGCAGEENLQQLPSPWQGTGCALCVPSPDAGHMALPGELQDGLA